MERLVEVIPLPYTVGALVVAVVIGAPGQFVALLADTGDFGRAITAYQPAGGAPLDWAFAMQQIWSVLIPLYALLGTRYMRSRVVLAEPAFRNLCRQGRADWLRAFRWVSRPEPPVVLTIGFLVALGPTLYAGIVESAGMLSSIFIAASILVLGAAVATFLGVFFSSIWALRELGRTPLRLRPFLEDRMLGLRPFGTLSLSLAFAYFLGHAVGGIEATLLFNPLEPGILGGFIASTTVGILMFVLSLNTIHRQLASAKNQEVQGIRSSIASIVAAPETHEQTTILSRLLELRSLEAAEREASAIRTWPVDTGILSRFAAFVVAVTALLVAQLIFVWLGLI